MAQRKTTAKAKAPAKAKTKAKATAAKAAPAAQPRKPDKPYDVKSWGGQPLYQCKLCPFNSLHERALLSHIVNKHAPQPQPSALVGPDGKPLDKED